LRIFSPIIPLLLLVHECGSSFAQLFEGFDHDVALVLQSVEVLFVTVVIINGEKMTVMKLSSSDNTIE